MISEHLLFEIFEKEVERLGPLSGLSSEESKRIVEVFKDAVSDPYMDEYRILKKLVGRNPKHEVE
jgi:hypothetical protein